MRLLDLFCGRWGWSKAFAARGWECVGVDLVEPPETPSGCSFIRGDILTMFYTSVGLELYDPYKVLRGFDFIVASSPCEQFSVHGMKHFHPNPPYPELGIKLFNHVRQLCEAASVPYVMENVRAAEMFVGPAIHRCGPYFLWGSGVPPLMPKGISKGAWQYDKRDENGKRIYSTPASRMWSTKRKRLVATIPPELANCVADYAERLIEQRQPVVET